MSDYTPPKYISQAASIFVMFVGCLVLLVGWGLDIDVFKSGLSHRATMKANTALCFILAGLSLWLSQRGKRGRNLHSSFSLIASGCAVIVALVGFLTLCQYLFDWNLGIDELLVRDSTTPYPGRMADNTALNFVLMGGALWLLARKRGTKRGNKSIIVGQCLSLLALGVALLALIGHGYGVKGFYTFIVYSTSMALHTAVTFVVLGVGILFTQVDGGVMQPLTTNLIGGLVARRLMPAAVVVPLFVGWLILQGVQANYYDYAFGMALLVLSLNVIFAALIWQNAIFLNRLDGKRQRTEAALRESEARFQRLVSNVPGVIYQYVLHPDGMDSFTYVSPQCRDIYELEPKELLQDFSQVWAMVHPEDVEKIQHANTISSQRLEPFEVEFRIIPASGRLKWIQAKSQPQRLANGDVIYDGLVMDVSDRKQAEASLHESQARLELALQATNTVLWERDLNTNQLRFINPLLRSEQQVQIPYSVALAQVHPDDQAALHEANETAISSLSSFEIEHRVSVFGGQEEDYDWVLARAQVISDETGKPMRMMGVSVDITKRKQAQLASQKYQERLQLFVESDLIGIVTGDVYGGLTEVNDAFLKIIGYTRDEFQASQVGWLDITPPEYLPLDEAAIAEAKINGVCDPYEKEYICKDGSRVPILIGYALVGENKEDAVAYILDNSARKRAEIERDRFFTLSLDMLCIVGFDGYFKRINPAFEKILGYSRAELLSQRFSYFLHPDDLATSEAEMANLMAGNTTINFENRYLCKDGSYKWLVWSTFPVVEEQLLYAVAHDITARKAIEIQLRQFNDTLEERVRQRTAQLEGANKELESFSYSVSHDLRAPLRHITGFVDLLQKHLGKQELDTTSLRYLNIISETTKTAGKLIDDLLAFSRMGRAEMRLTKINMNTLLHEVQRDLQPETRDRQVNWQIQPLPVVPGDPSMLRLVLRNLLENALKYSRDRSITEITVGNIPSEGEPFTNQEVIFFIRDNGVGFDMRYVHKLFGVFQRLHSDSEFEGTGVGLANVQRIIHRHGGRVWAESELGKGATFYFSLPKEIEARGGE